MIDRALPALTLALAAPAIMSADDPPRDLAGTQWAQVTIRERIVIRVPRVDVVRIAPRYGAAPPVRWTEGKAPACVPARTIVGAAINGNDVDLVNDDGSRLRARLDDDCPTLDFYTGFYLKRPADGKICVRRDALRSRSGARCEIARFRLLTARR